MSALVLSPAESPSSVAPAARFGWDIIEKTWTWSPEMYLLHGFGVDAVEPSTEQALSQVHPADLHGWVDAMHAGMHHHRLVVHEHRLVERSGRIRRVLLVAQPALAADGLTKRVQGILLPLDGDDTLVLGADQAPELVLLVMNALAVGQVAARVLLGRCAPAPSGWGRHRLQVVAEHGSAETPGDALRADVSAALLAG